MTIVNNSTKQNKMPTVIVVKDDFGTAASAESITHNILKQLKAAKNDINLKKIVVAINDTVEDSLYSENLTLEGIEFTTVTVKQKLTFAEFHNFVVDHIDNNIDKNVNLHIVSGSLMLFENDDAESIKSECKTMIGSFVNDLLDMTKLLKRPVWFGTASDGANYSFNHYFTVADILNIDGKVKHFIAPECIMWAGNSNLDWIYTDLTKFDANLLKFDQIYDYDFLEIKNLIAKFASLLPGFYINLFPTIPREVGAYFRIPEFNRDNQQYDLKSEKYKQNIDLYLNNTKDIAAAQPKTINDAMIYMQKVLPKKK